MCSRRFYVAGYTHFAESQNACVFNDLLFPLLANEDNGERGDEWQRRAENFRANTLYNERAPLSCRRNCVLQESRHALPSFYTETPGIGGLRGQFPAVGRESFFVVTFYEFYSGFYDAGLHSPAKFKVSRMRRSRVRALPFLPIDISFSNDIYFHNSAWHENSVICHFDRCRNC